VSSNGNGNTTEHILAIEDQGVARWSASGNGNGNTMEHVLAVRVQRVQQGGQQAATAIATQ